VDFLFLCVFLSRLLCWWGYVFGVRFQDGYTFSLMVKEISEVGYGCRCIILFSFVSHLTFLFSSSLFHCHFRSRVIVEKQETRPKSKRPCLEPRKKKKKRPFFLVSLPLLPPPYIHHAINHKRNKTSRDMFALAAWQDCLLSQSGQSGLHKHT
jgi:hypothetical protein